MDSDRDAVECRLRASPDARQDPLLSCLRRPVKHGHRNTDAGDPAADLYLHAAHWYTSPWIISPSQIMDSSPTLAPYPNSSHTSLTHSLSGLTSTFLLNLKMTYTTITTRWGIISGRPVTFCRNSSNYYPNLRIFSALWTEIICVQAQTKICHRTLIPLLHYLTKTSRSVTTEPLAFYNFII